MTFLSIGTHKRYAVRQAVSLSRGNGCTASGLMIEISSEACRISNLDCAHILPGETVAIQLDDLKLNGSIRWMREGIAGVKFQTPLFPHELRDLIARMRPALARQLPGQRPKMLCHY